MKTLRLPMIYLIVLWAAVVHSNRFSDTYASGRFSMKPSCYIFVLTPYTWQEANNYCHKQGGNLVSIDNKGENDHLVRIIKLRYNRDFWAGGNDISSEGVWQWVADNSRLCFTNWDRGQPDNYKGIEHCLALVKRYAFRWNDSRCGTKRSFICEKAC